MPEKSPKRRRHSFEAGSAQSRYPVKRRQALPSTNMVPAGSAGQRYKNLPGTRGGQSRYLNIYIRHEVMNKISEVGRIWYKLTPHWKASRSDKKWKLIVFDTIIRSKLLYSLEAFHCRQILAKNLDAFQMRGLRKIFCRPTKFYDRTCTNQRVIQEATSIVHRSL